MCVRDRIIGLDWMEGGEGEGKVKSDSQILLESLCKRGHERRYRFHGID